MRKVDSNNFQIATRTTSREINRKIAINLVREHDGISRAELAQRMGVQKSAVTLIIKELIEEGLISEGRNGVSSSRGPKRMQLHVSMQHRRILAVDIRFTGTYLMLSDFNAKQIALERFETIFDPKELVNELARRVTAMLRENDINGHCAGIGVAAPGMVDYRTGRILFAPIMNWRNVDIKDDLAQLTKLPVSIESAPKASALSKMWLNKDQRGSVNNFVYVGISDGVGAGAVVGGELLRGSNNTATEFGHIPLNIAGPRCLCGLTGCWEAYVSNLATLSRYLGRTLSRNTLLQASTTADEPIPTITEIIGRAHNGDHKAIMAIETTGRFIGLGLANILAALNPERIFIGGEITSAWDMISDQVRSAMAERSLTDQAAQTPIEVVDDEYPRLRGAVALVTAPIFAAPRVA